MLVSRAKRQLSEQGESRDRYLPQHGDAIQSAQCVELNLS